MDSVPLVPKCCYPNFYCPTDVLLLLPRLSLQLIVRIAYVSAFQSSPLLNLPPCLRVLHLALCRPLCGGGGAHRPIMELVYLVPKRCYPDFKPAGVCSYKSVVVELEVRLTW
jgi:hypothetical protein